MYSNKMENYKPSSSDIINQCQYLQRLIFGLIMYENLRNKTSKHSLSLFLNETYKIEVFLNDIKHYIMKHGNNTKQVEQIRNEMISSSDYNFTKCSLSECAYTVRHFDREKNEENTVKNAADIDDPFINFYSLQFDNVHFNVMHLIDAGFRVTFEEMETKEDTENKDTPMIVFRTKILIWNT